MKTNKEIYLELKQEAGSHSPSISLLRKTIENFKIEVDACFLSNPYATDLFLKNLKTDLIENNEINRVLEFYPTQAPAIAKRLSENLKVSPENIFIGNGAIEIIQAVIHNYLKGSIVINIPTFSSYYEFVREPNSVIYYQLKKECDYKLNVQEYIRFVKKSGANAAVIINPNNPDGNYIPLEEILEILTALKDLDFIIIDESFIHFAYETEHLDQVTVTNFFHRFDNLVIIKSMSKDFGIAGVRAGYGLMPKIMVEGLYSKGYLWNINGLAEYFFTKYSDANFLKDYEIVRKQYIKETQKFHADLKSLKGLNIIPGMANFFLVEINAKNLTSEDLFLDLLFDYGVYVRNCDDKIGLNGEYIRVAARSSQENAQIIRSLQKVLEKI